MSNTGPSLQMKYIFGLKSGDPQVFHVDEHKVVYPAGHNVITYNIEDKLMQYYPSNDSTVKISHMSISPSRRYLAVCEKAKKALCIVYDTQTQRRKKIISNTESSSEEYIASSFPPDVDYKFLVAISGPPDFEIQYWQWERPRLLAVAKLGVNRPIYGVGFNLLDHTRGWVITGQSLFRCYRYAEKEIVPGATALQAELSSENYTAQAWTKDGRLLVGTDEGQIAVLSNDLQTEAVLYAGAADFNVHCILPFEGGFLAGGDQGRIVGFTMDQEDEMSGYLPTPFNLDIQTSPVGAVKSLSLSYQSEEYLVAALDNSQIYITNFNPTQPSEELNFTPLSYGFHFGAVTGLDVCIRKPIIVTCGNDRTVRIWNYQTKKLEVTENFHEDPYSVAIHPSGFHIIVGFADKIRLLNIFNDKIQSYKELPIKVCREIKFSHGGHLFAVVANQAEIHVYNFYNADCPQSMVFKGGHNGRVKSIVWKHNDIGFVSCGADGSVIEWALYNKTTDPIIQDYTKKVIVFNDIIYQPIENANIDQSGIIYTVGSDRVINEIQERSVTHQYDCGITLGQVSLSFNKKLLYAGVAEAGRPGSIRAYKWGPFTGDYVEYQAHSAEVERMRVSYDGTHIFSAGRDGCVCIFEVKDRDLRNRENKIKAITLSDELIITKSDIQDYHMQIETLNNTILDNEMTAKMALERSVQEKVDQIDKLKEQIDSERQSQQHQYTTLAEEYDEIADKSEKDLKQYEIDLSQQLSDKETSYSEELVKATDRRTKLQKDRQDQEHFFDQSLKELDQIQDQELREQAERHKVEVEEEDAEIESMEGEIELMLKRFDEINRQIEADNGNAYEELKNRGNKELQDKRGECSKYKGQLSIEKKKYRVIKDEINDFTDEKKINEETIDRNYETIEKLKQEKEIMIAEIAERDKTIGVKENRIYDLKRKNQELEKFKYVLDYKIKELRNDIIPREDEITRMKEQTKRMNHQLKQFNAVNEQFGIQLEDLRDRQAEMQAGIKHQRSKLRESGNLINSFKIDMEESAQHIQDYNLLKEHIINIYQKYVKDSIRPKIIDTDIQGEYSKQHMYLLNNKIQLSKKLTQECRARKKDSQRIMKDNQELIEVIYDLREKVKGMSNVRRQAELTILKCPKGSASLLTSPRKLNQTLPTNLDDTYREEMLTHRDEIKALREQLTELEMDSPQRKPLSGEKLPPIRPLPSPTKDN